MNRYVMKDIQLSDGTVLPKGSRIFVASKYMDPAIYPDPERFDAARFMHMRQQPGNENSWQFVTTSADHMFFGHGMHACPGRFFASNEIKIALCYFLINYDWRLVPGGAEPEMDTFEGSLSVSEKTTVEFRRRAPEINLDSLS